VLSPSVLVAIAVTVVAWASAFIVIRGTAPYFTGGAVALGRLIVGTVLLGIVVLIGRRWVWPTRREWIYIAIFGIAWFGGYNVALNTAEHTIDAGTTSMLVNIGPILIALGAGIFLREGIP
jgi:drug/metabolite transporter (DMT)-like permease